MSPAGNLKVLVAHPAQQHSYRLAAALKAAGCLGGYATTVYNKPGSATRLVAKLLRGPYKKKAEGRRTEDLHDSEVIQLCELGGLVVLFCHNIPFARRWYWQIKRIVEDRFAKRVARYAIENGFDAVISYDGTSPLLFETLKEKAPSIVRIMDMSASNALYLRHVYETDFSIKPDFAEKLKSEWMRIWDPIDTQRTERELASTEYFLCGSSFVQKSLAFSGIGANRCRICPYGVDTEHFSCTEEKTGNGDSPLRAIYIGATNELKGIAYLLDGFMRIPQETASLTVVGRNNLPDELLQRYKDRVSFLGQVPRYEVASLLNEADVMILPSLGEGFSLSIMEALSAGLPVICSENSGSSEVIRNGENGFVIPIQDEQAIVGAVEWFACNKDRIPAMAANARATAEKYTWDDYSICVADAVKGVCREKRAGKTEGK